MSKDDPIHTDGTTEELRGAISRKMQPCNAVLILAGIYSTYSHWINREVEIAKEKGKAMIAIEPWGSERTSQYVKENANKIVGWNTNSNRLGDKGIGITLRTVGFHVLTCGDAQTARRDI